MKAVSLAVVYAVGALSSLMYMRMMLKISTTTLMRIRNDLFCKMEKLPIRFFDKHTHGELMSLYTNDTDAIREMLSNSVAQFISSAITIVGVFASMLYFSWQLTILVVVMLFVIVKVIGFVGSHSGRGFIAQQKALGRVNGYIEEMINGQKVIKVFCYRNGCYLSPAYTFVLAAYHAGIAAVQLGAYRSCRSRAYLRCN